MIVFFSLKMFLLISKVMVKRDQAETYVTLHSDLDGAIVSKILLLCQNGLQLNRKCLQFIVRYSPLQKVWFWGIENTVLNETVHIGYNFSTKTGYWGINMLKIFSGHNSTIQIAVHWMHLIIFFSLKMFLSIFRGNG